MESRAANHCILATRTLAHISGTAQGTVLMAHVQLCATQILAQALKDPIIKLDPNPNAKPQESLESIAQFP